ncbi:polymer-forming cytoskeletal protein [Paenibacillaceae bacterium]|nr:polymer-forming cytoskeletal protein [Paenibacillaceae bacterium]
MAVSRLEHDLTVSGIQKIAAGSYRNVRVEGIGTAIGELECISLHVDGTFKLKGALIAESTEINGIGTFKGTVSSGRVHIEGAATVHGDLSGATAQINGKCYINGSVRQEKMDVYGMFSTRGDVQCEWFACEGRVNVKGALNAGEVNIKLAAKSNIREIGGGTIHIHRSEHKSFGKMIGLISPPKLVANIIEGDDLFLENCEVDTVRGARVVIGHGCKIHHVEYIETFQLDPKSRVGSSRQI